MSFALDRDLLGSAGEVAGLLRQRGETVAVAESSAGGLIAAALLAIPGASAYFRGGGVVYTGDAKATLLGVPADRLATPRAATEEHALVLAEGIRVRLSATWGIGETGAAGPTGNRYGDPAGHTSIATSGLRGAHRTLTVRTGRDERGENMRLFAIEALRLLEGALRDP